MAVNAWQGSFRSAAGGVLQWLCLHARGLGRRRGRLPPRNRRLLRGEGGACACRDIDFDVQIRSKVLFTR